MLSRKFSDKVSLQVSPTFIYKNLVLGVEENHFTCVLPDFRNSALKYKIV
ncbi:DUF5777 family beta-barrel protein [bacterium]|nr:DUF5777 family beta-barrel protein [bacterium]